MSDSMVLVGVVGLVIMFVLIFLKVWIGVAMALMGILGYAFVSGFPKAFVVAGTEPFAQGASYTLSAIPLFIFMGVLFSNTGISTDLYNAASKWIGHVKGGLAMATVIACGAFAAVTGSSMAGAVTMGKVAFPEMKRYNYSPRMAAGSICAGGTVGIMIPPSIGFIIYGLLTEQSVGRLFIAGIFPGLLQVVFYVVTIIILCRINPSLGPASPKATTQEKLHSTKDFWPIAVIFIIVMGGIYAGIFTPTEAAAVGSFAAILVCLVQKYLTKDNFYNSMLETARNTSMLIFIMAGAFIFMRFITVSGLPFALSNYVNSLPLPSWAILLAIVIFYFVLGFVMDVFAILILTLPIFFPTIVELGYDPIWFGVIMVRLIEMGCVTPPFGMNLFVLLKTIKIKTSELYRGVMPFIIADVLHISLLIAVPQISLFLVSRM